MNLKQKIMDFFKDDEGATGIEYALIAVMVAVVLVAFTSPISEAVKGIFQGIETELKKAAGTT